jgi:hypothetical protein
VLEAGPLVRRIAEQSSGSLARRPGGAIFHSHNQQWRICFTWPAGEPGPSNVEIVDYH